MNFELIGHLLWILFLISWWLAMFWTAKAVSRASSRQGTLYFLGFGLGFWLIFARPEWFGGSRSPVVTGGLHHIWETGEAPGILLILLEVASFAFAWWARIHLGKLWSGMMTLREGHRVVDTGPYRLVRHPIYTGFIGGGWALALIKGSRFALAGAAVLTVIMAIKAKDEEKLLRRELGEDAYESYARRTPMLIPFFPI